MCGIGDEGMFAGNSWEMNDSCFLGISSRLSAWWDYVSVCIRVILES